MHEIKDAVVHRGQLMLSHLPFPDGQHVRVIVTESATPSAQQMTIQKVRELLAGCASTFDPSEPMIPEADWESLK